MRARARALLVVALLGTASAIQLPAEGAEIRMLISNFRFCIERPFPCDPLDVGYVPGPDGAPLVPVYSPIVTPGVRPGDVVTWVYADTTGCDLFDPGCAGHEVRFPDGTQVGFAAARSGATTITWQVPEGLAPGTYPYFCAINNHYLSGMTGALRIA